MLYVYMHLIFGWYYTIIMQAGERASSIIPGTTWNMTKCPHFRGAYVFQDISLFLIRGCLCTSKYDS